MIEARKRPGVTNPLRQKRDHGCRRVRIRQRRAITEGNFHLCRRQRASELFGDGAVRAVSAHQVLGQKLCAALCADNPAGVGMFECAPGYFFRQNIRAGFARAFKQESIKRDSRVDRERFVEFQMQMLSRRRVHIQFVDVTAYGPEQVRPGLQSF